MRYLPILIIPAFIAMIAIIAPEQPTQTFPQAGCTFSEPVPLGVYLYRDTARVDVMGAGAPDAFSHREAVNEWLRANGYRKFAGVAGTDSTDALWIGEAMYVCATH